MRLAAPTTLVDINRVRGLDAVEVTGDGVRVGALARHAALLSDDAAARVQPLLARATVNVADPAIRNRGTTVGSIAHADPSGEMTAVLALTGGSVQVASGAGERDVVAADFFAGPPQSSLGPRGPPGSPTVPAVAPRSGPAVG